MKVFVVTSKIFGTVVGAYTDAEIARRLSVTQNGVIEEVEIDFVHPGHQQLLDVIYKD